MIALTIPARSGAPTRFVTRLSGQNENSSDRAALVSRQGTRRVYSSANGLFELTLLDENVEGDVIVVDPARGMAERLIRAGSDHNTLLVTERCDQLCVMCSQPPKKTHVDRWAEFQQAALLSPHGKLIGLSGGEPTLFKNQLFDFLENVISKRPDLTFHVLTNAQHFDQADRQRLSRPVYANVTWGIPLYAANADIHDAIVAKAGAHERLRQSLAVLLEAGAHIELRTVVLASNIAHFPHLAEYVAGHLGFIDQWSIMQLEAIGFAKARFAELIVNTRRDFSAIGGAIDMAQLFGVPVALFNFPLCSIPSAYQRYSVSSISDWKQKYAEACRNCSAKQQCGGFFAWHPDEAMDVTPL